MQATRILNPKQTLTYSTLTVFNYLDYRAIRLWKNTYGYQKVYMYFNTTLSSVITAGSRVTQEDF